MDSYTFLAHSYDDLTSEIPYDSFIDFYKAVFAKDGGEFRLILDLCCGTGTISCKMAKLGYDMISVDASNEMLIEAQNKSYSMDVSPLFICQKAHELDLYGCVDACISSLDSINYIEPRKIDEVFYKLHLFIRPNGLLIFDIRSEEWLRSLDNTSSINDAENTFCVWNTSIISNEVTYKMDIFSRINDLWDRQSETHKEYIYSLPQLHSKLESAGFSDVEIIKDGPQGELGRIFIISKNRY